MRTAAAALLSVALVLSPILPAVIAQASAMSQDVHGNVYICDHSNIAKFTPDLRHLLQKWTVPKLQNCANTAHDRYDPDIMYINDNWKLPYRLNLSSGILSPFSDMAADEMTGPAVDMDNNVLLSTGGSAGVVRFSPDGKAISSFLPRIVPWSFTVDKYNFVYVSNGAQQPAMVQRYTPTGEYNGTFVTANPVLHDPSGVAVNDDMTVLVADTANNRAVLFDADGTFLTFWNHTTSNMNSTKPDDHAPTFSLPKAVGFGRLGGNILILDYQIARVLSFPPYKKNQQHHHLGGRRQEYE